MLLHPDRYSPTTLTRKNGVVIHDSEGAEGLLPWGITSSAQLIAALASPGDRPSTTKPPPAMYGAGYHAVACEDGTYTQVATAAAAPYHAPPCNPTWWSICIPGKAAQTRAQWLDTPSRAYIRAVAAFIVNMNAQDRQFWPFVFQSAAELRALDARTYGNPGGYTSHGQISLAWKQTNHTDPGVAFPWDVLADDIADLIHPISEESSTMFLIKDAVNPDVDLVVDAPNLPRKRFRVHVLADQFDELNAAYGPVCQVSDRNAYGNKVG